MEYEWDMICVPCAMVKIHDKCGLYFLIHPIVEIRKKQERLPLRYINPYKVVPHS